jgi:hypothetical protein
LESPKVILKGEVPGVRNVDGGLRIACEERRPNEWDPPIAPYDPAGRAMSSLMTDARCAATHQ